MNAHQISEIKITPDVVDCIVFWTKNPLPMMKRLNEIKDYNYYFQFTLTGYGNDVEVATVYKGNIIKNLIMDCQSYTKYRPNETTGGIFVSWRRKEELPTGA